MEAFRIIQSYHVTEHAIFKQIKGFLTACRNTAAYCIFLPFGTSDPLSKFRRYQDILRNHWASAPMTKGNRLWKRKQNLLRRDDYFYFHHYSCQICITDQAWGQYDWIFGQIPFLHFVHRDQVEANKKKMTLVSSYILTEQAWSIGFILWQNYRGFYSQRFVLRSIWYFASRQATKTLIYVILSLSLPASIA